MTSCACSETSYFRSRGLPIPAAHNCEYVRLRQSLIPGAIVTAGRRPDGPKKGATLVEIKKLSGLDSAWQQRFFEAIDLGVSAHYALCPTCGAVKARVEGAR